MCCWDGTHALAGARSEKPMRTCLTDELKSGPEKKIGGPFDIKAVTGDGKGKTFCYV